LFAGDQLMKRRLYDFRVVEKPVEVVHQQHGSPVPLGEAGQCSQRRQRVAASVGRGGGRGIHDP
jgi:hypothetical protein